PLAGNGCLRDYANGMTTNKKGAVFIVGQVETQANRFSPYLAKYHLDGYLLWHIVFPAGSGEGMDVEVDKTGQIYVIGQFVNFLDLDQNVGNGHTHLLSDLPPASPNEQYNQAVFITKFSDNPGAQPPTFQWSYLLPTTRNTSSGQAGQILGNGISIDHVGNVFVTGSFTQNIDFQVDFSSTAALSPSNGGFDLFVAKLKDVGTSASIEYSFTIGGPTEDKGGDILCLSDKGFYLTGSFTGSPDFSPLGLPPTKNKWENPDSPQPAMFLAQYYDDDSLKGIIRWSYQFTLTSGIPFGGIGLALDNDHVYMVGNVLGGTQPVEGVANRNVTTPPAFPPLPSSPDQFIYVAASTHNQMAEWAVTLNQSGNEEAGGIAYDPLNDQLAIAIENASSQVTRVEILDAGNGGSSTTIEYPALINQSGTSLFFPGMDVSYYGGSLYFASSFSGNIVDLNDTASSPNTLCEVGSLTNSLDMFLAKYHP
ncbi:MAG: hypothetical protein KDC44_11320, partial [Phaeodactylibacter sp.]|nr:hypothetical protein [Phaeodactylibacter sp.]